MNDKPLLRVILILLTILSIGLPFVIPEPFDGKSGELSPKLLAVGLSGAILIFLVIKAQPIWENKKVREMRDYGPNLFRYVVMALAIAFLFILSDVADLEDYLKDLPKNLTSFSNFVLLIRYCAISALTTFGIGLLAMLHLSDWLANRGYFYFGEGALQTKAETGQQETGDSQTKTGDSPMEAGTGQRKTETSQAKTGARSSIRRAVSGWWARWRAARKSETSQAKTRIPEEYWKYNLTEVVIQRLEALKLLPTSPNKQWWIARQEWHSGEGRFKLEIAWAEEVKKHARTTKGEEGKAKVEIDDEDTLMLQRCEVEADAKGRITSIRMHKPELV